MSRVDALLREREGYVKRGLANRVAQVDAELARFGVAVEPATEAAADTEVVETAVKRGPGRPRKGA